MTGIERAFEILGGLDGFCKTLNVRQGTATVWKHRGSVPLRHCYDVHIATGVPMKDLQPAKDKYKIEGRAKGCGSKSVDTGEA